ncbi:hypothetical protein AKJ09_03673 [Labilithrix luteola]|uniref:Uncharacterized protein n=1 Tax=Labilithrix luteola TaxID=1391654 RepID=A0A0K1PV51_9BACT|nr:hypothetical protein [Labilithrix luteola]AKU97009.1 hypothetical protein AKJ09_03673 [Labilithrix luteola]
MPKISELQALHDWMRSVGAVHVRDGELELTLGPQMVRFEPSEEAQNDGTEDDEEADALRDLGLSADILALKKRSA